MKMQMSNQMRMEQRMKLAPRMIQSMEVLQLPLLALQEKIEAELNSNPVLEQAEEADSGAASPERTAEESARDESIEQQQLRIREDQDYREDFQRLDNLGEGFAEYLGSDSGPYRPHRDGEPDKKQEALQNTADDKVSLHEFLSEQWRLIEAEPEVKKAGQRIIDFIDDKGYLTIHLEQLTNKDKNEFTLDHLLRALTLVQRLDPPGVGARDLRECLLIQMNQSSEDLSFEMELVEEHWTDLLENRLPQIAQKMNCTLEQVNEALGRLSRLDTSPGLQVGRTENHPITADILVEPDGAGSWRVTLTDTRLPSLRVNRFYLKMAHDRGLDARTRDFLQQNIRSAQWFMDAIEQRKQTILRVATAVILHQKEFLEKGRLFLRPLPMQTIADQIGVHISTISRAVAGKYVQCPQGILPLRGFFSSGTETADGQTRSWDAVKSKLQDIVDTEDKSNPLSDDEILIRLHQSGFNTIARRTVAKYRKLLHIPIARFRKKY
ncbi:MAG: RNA polymerase factor sigma-54 [Phycisphaerae bacterium]|nr:RNA polymerase factor sigma-54 [Phycisphaerae bacterium]